MTEVKKDVEFESTEAEIASLKAEKEAFEHQQKAVIEELNKLRAAEDPATGTYYAQEIFQLSQDKLRLEAEVDIRRRKINRLSMPEPTHGMLQ